MIAGNNKLSSYILVLAWILVQTGIILYFGVVTGFESGKYIEQANNLVATGTVSTRNFWLYSVQIFLIAVSIKLHAGYYLVVAVQLLFNALATFYFYRFCRKISNEITAYITTFLLILNFPFQQFNSFLFTESLFFSFIILFSCFLFQLEKLSFKSLLLIILFLVLICFTRPTGLLLVPCVFIYLFSRFLHSWPIVVKIFSTIIVSLIFIFILNLALGSGGELNFILPFTEEHIICGVPTITTKEHLSGNSLWDILTYIFDHPGQFTHLAWLRSLAYWGMVRSYFSWTHNLFLTFYFFPIYLFAILGLKNWWRRNRTILFYSLSFITITWVTVTFSCDDWHNRFILSTFPFLLVLAMGFFTKKESRVNSSLLQTTHK